MKITSEVYLEAHGVAVVHLWDGVSGKSYRINVEEAMNIYPQHSVEAAVAKIAKQRFKNENAFTGYD